MANSLRSSVATLLTRLQAYASEPIVYSRGALSINCNATVGRKLLKVNDGAGQTRIEVTDADFLIPASALVLEGKAIEPERGDRIFLEAPDVDSLFEVLPYGDEPPFRWSDPYRTICRVHTKLIEQGAHQGVAGPSPPLPASATPSSGSHAATTAVTITGSGFVVGATVAFGGSAATSVVVVNSTTITCLTPTHALGVVNVVVTNLDGQAGTLIGGYTYTGVNTDLWNEAGYNWNEAAFNWATVTLTPFSMLNLPSLASWIKADGTLWQLSSLSTPATADGDRVGAWVASGGSAGNWLQATAGNRPTLKKPIQNGLPVIRFDGANGFLKLAANIASIGDFSIFFAASFSAVGSDSILLASNNTTSYICDLDASSFTFKSQGVTAASNFWQSGIFRIYEMHRSGSTYTFYRDGIKVPGSNTTNFAFNVGQLSGWSGSATFPIAMDLGEMVICTAVLPDDLSNTGRRQPFYQLQGRWGTRR